MQRDCAILDAGSFPWAREAWCLVALLHADYRTRSARATYGYARRVLVEFIDENGPCNARRAGAGVFLPCTCGYKNKETPRRVWRPQTHQNMEKASLIEVDPAINDIEDSVYQSCGYAGLAPSFNEYFFRNGSRYYYHSYNGQHDKTPMQKDETEHDRYVSPTGVRYR